MIENIVRNILVFKESNGGHRREPLIFFAQCEGGVTVMNSWQKWEFMCVQF